MNIIIWKLPKKVTFASGQWVSYQYNASGTKLKKTLSTGNVTDYVGNVLYENNVVYQISHEEGRAILNGTNYDYQFDISDHLGSLRVSFKDSLGIPKITQAQDYDPLGVGVTNW
ncbi:MAG: hypothetical protein U5N85_07920 [Arcicella sp.]|nr:hypothetical protein [Arcicella sp.]